MAQSSMLGYVDVAQVKSTVLNQLFNWVFLWIPMAFLLVTNYFVAIKQTLLLIPAVEEVKKQFGIERIIVVADKAMNSKTNVLAMFEQGMVGFFHKSTEVKSEI